MIRPPTECWGPQTELLGPQSYTLKHCAASTNKGSRHRTEKRVGFKLKSHTVVSILDWPLSRLQRIPRYFQSTISDGPLYICIYKSKFSLLQTVMQSNKCLKQFWKEWKLTNHLMIFPIYSFCWLFLNYLTFVTVFEYLLLYISEVTL